MAAASYDAVVVGAGAGGGAAAWRMTERGWRVLLLDAGPAFDPLADYGLDRIDWEKAGFRHKPGSQGEVTFAPMQSLDPAHGDLRSWSLVQGRTNRERTRAVAGPGYHHVRGIGGSTLHYTGEAHRLHPQSMRLRSEFGVGADWPLTYDELEPYYVEVERLVGVAGPADTGARWRSAPYPLPPHPRSLASHRLGVGAAALGLHWEVNPRAALSMAYDGRPPCNYCGGCTHGCPRRDKGSADVTFIAKAVASGRCDVRARHTVLRLGFAAGPGPKRVASIDAADASGRMQRIPVRRLVLACGAVETPRLLLQSGIGGGQVGRHFLESVAWTSIADAVVPLRSFGGLPADAISWDRNAPDAIAGVVGGYRLSAAIHEAGMIGAVAHAQRAVAGFGLAHKAAMRRSVGSLVAVGAVGESLPNERCYIDLDPKRRDAFGRPLARIHSHVDAMTIRRLQAMAGAARALLAASGAARLVEEFGTYDHFSSTHVFGGCRMGADPRSSVVDAAGRIHGALDLHVCDASVFPSSGGGEAPVLTIQALALRAVDRMPG